MFPLAQVTFLDHSGGAVEPMVVSQLGAPERLQESQWKVGVGGGWWYLLQVVVVVMDLPDGRYGPSSRDGRFANPGACILSRQKGGL